MFFMNIKMLKFSILALFMMSIATWPAMAQLVRLTDMDAANFGVWSGSGNLTQNDVTCVYRDTGTTRYRVTGTDNSTITPGAFHLENPTHTIELPYQVKWRSKPTNGGKTLPYGSPINRKNANQSSQTCAIDGLTSNMRIRIKTADLQAAPASFYSAEVTIVIEPR